MSFAKPQQDDCGVVEGHTVYGDVGFDDFDASSPRAAASLRLTVADMLILETVTPRDAHLRPPRREPRAHDGAPRRPSRRYVLGSTKTPVTSCTSDEPASVARGILNAVETSVTIGQEMKRHEARTPKCGLLSRRRALARRTPVEPAP